MKLLKKIYYRIAILRRIYRSFLTTPRYYSIRRSLLARGIRFIIEPHGYQDMLERAIRWARDSGLDGDYLEFGVYEGTSFAVAFYWGKRCRLDSMKFYAFDSFQGLPSPKGIDAGTRLGAGHYSCSSERFKNMISKMGVDLSRVVITPGWFNEVLNEETKNKLGIRCAAAVLIDSDLYASAVPVLDFITDYLVNGSLLMFGGWFHFSGDPDRGQQRAIREWLAKNAGIELIEYHKFGLMGDSFIVHRTY